MKIEVAAALPFPLRVGSEPYLVENQGIIWTLVFERIQKQPVDERIAHLLMGEADLAQDRSGLATYSKVSGRCEAEMEPELALRSFVQVINILIVQARDILNLFWISTIQVHDLFQIQVVVEGLTYRLQVSDGPTALQPVVESLDLESDRQLREGLEKKIRSPFWRQIFLNGLDALHVDRREDAIVLSWTALESACRRVLPRLALDGKLTPVQLGARLSSTKNSKEPPYSFEDAVDRASGGMKIVETTVDLYPNLVYTPDTVKESARLAYRLRNKIVHQGVVVTRNDAMRAVEGVAFVLDNAIEFRAIPTSPPTLSWQQHFGRVPQTVRKFAASSKLRLILARPKDKYSRFAMESIDEELWIRFEKNMPGGIVESNMMVMWDYWHRRRMPDRPHLKVNARPGTAPIYYHQQADRLTDAACVVESLRALSQSRGSSVSIERLARYTLKHCMSEFASWAQPPCWAPPNARPAIDVAPLLAVLPPRSRHYFVRPLQETHAETARLSLTWAAALAGVDPDDEHGRCAVYRLVHDEMLWMYSVEVVCPIEGVAYGSDIRHLR